MNDVGRRLATLDRARPEWSAWTGPLGEALAEADDPAWREGVRVSLEGARDPGRPRLAGAVLGVPARRARRWQARLARAVAMPLAADRLEATLAAAVNQDAKALDALAASAGAPPTAFVAAANLLALPLLRAAAGKSRGPAGGAWSAGHCPTCAGWPLIAELRGLERARRLRCGRCGDDWAFDHLRCPFCGTSEHARLGALVPEAGGEARKVDTCGACRGYVKARATLAPWTPAEVLVEDLESVDLDLVALDRGFRRPEAPATALGARVVAG
jgi:FdhE protein